MREIKFRCFEKETKTMCKVIRIDFELKRVWTDKGWIELDRCTLIQYTGLKDKNGKEIYEGDILSEHTPSSFNYSIVKLGEINTGYFAFEPKMCTCFYHDYSNFNDNWESVPIGNNLKNIEVIGNVYENPELLEVEE